MNSETRVDSPPAADTAGFRPPPLSPSPIGDRRSAVSAHFKPLAHRPSKVPPARPAAGWCLDLLWSLVLGIWNFPSRRRLQKPRDRQVENLVEKAGIRCPRMGIDRALVNHLVEPVTADVSAQKHQQALGPQSVAVGRLLRLLKSVRSKSQQEQEKIRFREKAGASQVTAFPWNKGRVKRSPTRRMSISSQFFILNRVAALPPTTPPVIPGLVLLLPFAENLGCNSIIQKVCQFLPLESTTSRGAAATPATCGQEVVSPTPAAGRAILAGGNWTTPRDGLASPTVHIKAGHVLVEGNSLNEMIHHSLEP